MASSVTVTLDTSPPSVALGQVSQAGAELIVAYALSEPALLNATLTDAGGARFPGFIGVESVSFFGAVADGPAQLELSVRDDLLNAATLSFQLYVGAELGSLGAGHRQSRLSAAVSGARVAAGYSARAFARALTGTVRGAHRVASRLRSGHRDQP